MLRLTKIICFLMLMCLPCMVSSQEDIPANWWEDDMIVVKGYGLPPKNISNVAEAYSFARRAALVDGYRQMAEQINGIHITAETTIHDGILTGDIISTKVSAVVRGAKILSTDYDVDGSCIVVMAVPVYGGAGSIASLTFKPGDKEDFPEPTATVEAKGNYTGLIIDCGDLELKPVLAPNILKDDKGDNQSIYSYSNLDHEKVIANGMIGYATIAKEQSDDKPLLLTSGKFNVNDFIFLHAYAAENNTSRAGDNPLIIKAETLSDDNSCPVVSISDADKILIENQASHFLDEGAVVFVSHRVGGVRA